MGKRKSGSERHGRPEAGWLHLARPREHPPQSPSEANGGGTYGSYRSGTRSIAGRADLRATAEHRAWKGKSGADTAPG